MRIPFLYRALAPLPSRRGMLLRWAVATLRGDDWAAYLWWELFWESFVHG